MCRLSCLSSEAVPCVWLSVNSGSSPVLSTQRYIIFGKFALFKDSGLSVNQHPCRINVVLFLGFFFPVA